MRSDFKIRYASIAGVHLEIEEAAFIIAPFLESGRLG